MTPVDKLRSDRAYVLDAMRSIRSAADAETRAALTADEQARFDAGEAFIVECDRQIEEHNTLIRLAQDPAHVEAGAAFHAPSVIVRDDPFDSSNIRGLSDQAVRSQALRAVETGAFEKDAHRERIEGLVRKLSKEVAERVIVTGSPDYERAFAKILNDPYGISLSHEEREAFTRAASLTSNAGGYAVPVIIDPTLILTSDGSANPFRQIGRVIPVTNNVWKGVSTAGVSASFGAEAAAITEGSPTLAQPSVTVHKAKAQIDYSIEIGMDYPGFTSDMLMLLQDAKDTLEATKFAVGAGDGSNEPVGIVTALTGGSSEINTTTEALLASDLYAVEEALGPRFRPNASWVANRSIYNLIRQFDTAGGAALWERIGAGLPSQLLGYNAYEASAMDGTYNAAATANNYIMVLGDFRNYVIADRVGMSVEVVPHRVDGDGKLTGQRGLFAWWRVGADSVNDAAFTLLDLPTTA